MVIRRKPKAKAKAVTPLEKAKPSQPKVEDSEGCEVADEDRPQLSNTDASKPLNAKGISNEDVTEFSQEENDEIACGSELDNMADLEAHSRDGVQNAKVEVNSNAEVTAADVMETSFEEILKAEPDNIEEVVNNKGAIMGNKHKERKETPNKVENGEEESTNELNNEDSVGAPISHEKGKSADVDGASNTTDMEASDKGVLLVKSKEKRSLVEGDTDGLTTAKEIREADFASTNFAGPYMTEDITADDSANQVVEAGEGHVGLSEGHLSIKKKEKSVNGDSTIGKGLEESPRKKLVKKIVKRLVKRKVLVNQGRVEPQLSVVPEDAEQEKEKVSSVVTRTHDGQPDNEVKKTMGVIRKKKVLRKNGVPVTTKDESKLVGKGNVVIKNENLNSADNPESAEGNTMRDGQNMDESTAEGADEAKRVESGAMDKKPSEASKKDMVEDNESKGVAEAIVAKSSKKGKPSKKAESQGMIFMCTSKTKNDCFHYKVLGLPSSKKEMVMKVYKGMRLFLFDVDSRMLYGVYKAAGCGGYNIEPKAFNSSFPSQVRFTVLNDCPPLREEKFKQAIKDNYFTKNKFNCHLKAEQVKNLCRLFQDGKVAKLKPTGASGSSQQPRVAARPAAKPVRRDRVQSRASDASRQGSRKRSRADEMREDRKRKRARDDERRVRDNRRRNARSDPRDHHHPLPIASYEYLRHPVGYERRAYSPPPAFADSLPQALPPVRESSPYYGRTRTSILDSYRRDHHAQDQGLTFPGAALEYNRPDAYYLYRDPVARGDPYLGGRGHQDLYYTSSSRPDHYSPRISRGDYLQSNAPSSDFRVPPPPYRRY